MIFHFTDHVWLPFFLSSLAVMRLSLCCVNAPNELWQCLSALDREYT